jgi:hypothetical protein
MPKLTKSHSESSSAPKTLVAFRSLASFPSNPSIIAAIMMQKTAFSHLPSSAIFMLFSPMVSAVSVSKLGSSLKKDKELWKCFGEILIIIIFKSCLSMYF